MTPQEKAKELITKYKEIEIGSEGFHTWGMSDYQAKQAAIIAVDEILATGCLSPVQCGYIELNVAHREYWQQVKEEINKL